MERRRGDRLPRQSDTPDAAGEPGQGPQVGGEEPRRAAQEPPRDQRPEVPPFWRVRLFPRVGRERSRAARVPQRRAEPVQSELPRSRRAQGGGPRNLGSSGRRSDTRSLGPSGVGTPMCAHDHADPKGLAWFPFWYDYAWRVEYLRSRLRLGAVEIWKPQLTRMKDSHRERQCVAAHFLNINSLVQHAGGRNVPNTIQPREHSRGGDADGVVHNDEGAAILTGTTVSSC